MTASCSRAPVGPETEMVLCGLCRVGGDIHLGWELKARATRVMDVLPIRNSYTCMKERTG